MEPDFWRARWREGRIGFHEGTPNALLVKHLATLGERRRVLVPLCGKAEDLAYLAGQGHQVVGVELVEEAARAFFAEHGLTPNEERRGGLLRLTSGSVTLLAGDFFAVQPDDSGPVDALYDRAALIALPAPTRKRYVERLRQQLPEGARGLVVTFEYPQALIAGPPFAVLEHELRSLYDGLEVALLEERPAQGPRGLPANAPAKEKCFAVTF